MLGKLMKHEIKEMSFPFGITFLAAVLFTVFMKIVCMIPYGEGVREVIIIMGVYAMYFMIVIMATASLVLVCVRFYQTVVGDRGYLTWTLPAKTSTIIWSKLLAAYIWRIITGIVAIGMLVLFFSQNSIWEALNDVDYDIVSEIAGTFAEWFKPEYLITVALAILAILIFSALPMLMIYMCIAVGQLFGKWRILASIGCYFGLVVVYQILYIMLMVTFSILPVEDLFDNLNLSAFGMSNLMLGIAIVLGIIGCTVFYVITNQIFKKKLNLE